MSGVVYRVPPLSALGIRETATRFREVLELGDEPLFPIMKVLEQILDNRLDLLRLEVWPDEALQGAEGLNFRDDDGVDRIVLPETVYRGAWEHDGRSRFTAAHETGHWVLHSSCALARASETEIKPYQNSEWQANLFAAELLMPLEHIFQGDTAQDLTHRFRVSQQAAELRLNAIRRWRIQLKRKPPRGAVQSS